jgi:glycerol kinase
MKYVLAIDQGTTSSRAVLFNKSMEAAFISQKEFPQHFPKSGWVEHDPNDIWNSVLSVCKDVMKKAGITGRNVVSIGITNQRETTLIWNKKTGDAIHNAIVWQDRRTSDICAALKENNHEEMITETTGLLLDPYFSATKVKWLLDQNEEIRIACQNGDYLFGTVDTFLIWKLTDGQLHLTDATNASRTMLYDIDKNCWSEEICDLLGIPSKILPRILDCADNFGKTDSKIFGTEIPITGVAGDQHAATIGQACFEPGMVKSTYGTGCFVMLNTGNTRVHSKNRLLSTSAYRLDGETTYALEGSIFVAGAAVQWLRDGLKIISSASEAEIFAIKSDFDQKLYFVPAFTGLGAPYWDADARGAIYGLTRNSGPSEICRAVLESVGFQSKDLLDAMISDAPHIKTSILRVDGGMSASNWSMQFLSDIINASVDRPKMLETTALGAAWLSGMYSGFYPNKIEFSKNWQKDVRFEPKMDEGDRENLFKGWKVAVERTLLK